MLLLVLASCWSPGLLIAQDLEQGVEEAKSVGTHLKDVLTSQTIWAIAAVGLFVWAISRVLGWIVKLLAQRYNRYRLRILGVYPILNVILWLSFTVGVIDYLFDSETIWAFLASSTLVVGFAAKDTLANVFGGLWLVAERPFQLGDRIALDGQYGEVKGISIRSTIIQTLDDSTVTIPNARVINESISNANSGNLDCMTVIDLYLPIDVDPEVARKIAFEAAVTSPYINYDKAIQILFFDHFQDHPATNLKIKAYVLDARFEKAFEGDVTETAKKAFREAGLYTFNGH